MSDNHPLHVMRTSLLLSILSLTVCLGLAGCSDQNPLSGASIYPAKGKITLPSGSPLTSGNLVFTATKSTISCSAKIESDGSFTLSGLPEGEYQVRLEVDSASHAKKGSLPFPSKYLDEDASDLAATVKPIKDGNNFDFKLTPNPSGKSSRSGSQRGG